MTNRIVDVAVVDQVLIPAETILRVVVTVDAGSGGMELRGRFVGPRCAFAATVEVAYPLRCSVEPASANQLVGRVVIPEASFWDPESPFLYLGVVELWQDVQPCARVELLHGLRQIKLTPTGLRVNGRKLLLKGCAVEDCSESQARKLRERGINLWIVPVQSRALHLWELAERFGFFILGRIEPDADPALVRQFDRHASCLGWLVSPGHEVPAGVDGLVATSASSILHDEYTKAHFLICTPNQIAEVSARDSFFLVADKGESVSPVPVKNCLGSVETAWGA